MADTNALAVVSEQTTTALSKADAYLRDARLVPMMERINTLAPLVAEGTMNFGKTQTQCMDNLLTVNHPTPLRNARQMLAEIERTRGAIQEWFFKNEKVEIEIEELRYNIEQYKAWKDCVDGSVERPMYYPVVGDGPHKTQGAGRPATDFDLRRWEVELKEKLTNQESGKTYVNGAIRKMDNHMQNYQEILNNFGLTQLDEKAVEEQEESYHIQKALLQGLCAARAHGGMIDEGNHIYLQDIGVNGAVAQSLMTEYLQSEHVRIAQSRQIMTEAEACTDEAKRAELIASARAILPTHTDQMEFVKRIAEMFKGCTKDYCARKGFSPFHEESMLVDPNVQAQIPNMLPQPKTLGNLQLAEGEAQ